MFLAQFNIAEMKFPFDDLRFDEFKAWLNALHALAEKSPGFVWRYQGEHGEAGYIQPYKDQPLIMGNLSIWQDYDSLYNYTFKGPHLEIMKSKRKWFNKIDGPYNVLWWTDQPETSVLVARVRLVILQKLGPKPAAFTFVQRFTPEDLTKARRRV